MKITSIEYQKNPNRVNIFVDNVFSFGISDELRYKNNLEVGLEINDSLIEDLLDQEEQGKALNQALNFLSYRKRSEKELAMALRRKGFSQSCIEYAVDYCKDHNYINDYDFAEAYIRDKTNLAKLGVERIRHELTLKGIDRDIIDRVLVVDKDEQLELAMELSEKRLRSYENDSYEKKYRKLSGYLQRRGYSYDIISKVLKNLLKD